MGCTGVQLSKPFKRKRLREPYENSTIVCKISSWSLPSHFMGVQHSLYFYYLRVKRPILIARECYSEKVFFIILSGREMYSYTLLSVYFFQYKQRWKTHALITVILFTHYYYSLNSWTLLYRIPVPHDFLSSYYV